MIQCWADTMWLPKVLNGDRIFGEFTFSEAI